MRCSTCAPRRWESSAMRQPPTSSILEVRGLAYGYNGETLQHDVSFDVRRGSIFAIMGASGTGKSTLLKVLIGLQRPKAGEIAFGGVSYCALGDPEHAEIGRASCRERVCLLV